ncbi:uncharacterized protein MYCFIDRAFT_172600 [Pseudocercospora fijiensis CIRAD86]|uniref:Uncharacterized protein n=1 Tax=Pseudocercospora fijiensis (strain CIRAD86) TaxID=383855 RepID=M3BC99_PSEFD|nr:uncharacterized protein MYCFIDRAFT_172600 [Pseudocercospora fijiensis CIRAD86]EME86907.1 hypothetical protein MYCFIDRAFT_172600 [Pseudocercospora fijiensis CIRAD86]
MKREPLSDTPPQRSGLHKIVIGVDYGTTFTGISWVSTEGAHIKVLDDVHCVRDWPGGDNAWKAPTRIAYGDENGSSGNVWGYEVAPRMKSYAWMKLLLDPEQMTKYDDPSLTKSQGEGVLRKPLNKTAVEICADYLTELASFAYQSLEKRVSPEVLQATPLDFWFTVPAVWSDKAKRDTLRAAQKAAKQAKLRAHPDSQVFLIREPEAAAIAVLSDVTQDRRLTLLGGSENQVGVGQSILVCDCGGGTVDLTAYQITAITPKLEFKELVVGIGGKCGSTYIDREFMKWMEHKFKKAFTELPWEKRGPASRMMKDFEAHKKDFGKSTNTRKIYEVGPLVMKNAKNPKYYDEDEGIIRIYEEDLKRMFDPVVSKITELLQSQLDAERRATGKPSTIKTILLVGGFGDSTYLNKVLREWTKERGIKLLCPPNPQSAIVRGAAYSGLHGIQPSHRRSRLHYGFACHVAFDPMVHDKRDRFISDWDGTARASGNLFWQLEKGALVDQNTKIAFSVYRTISEESKYGKHETDVYVSDLDEAPDRVRDKGARVLVTFTSDFSKVDLSQYPSRKVKGRTLRRIDCEYIVHFGHRKGVLCFSCLVNGQEIGNTTVTFENQTEKDVMDGPGGSGGASPPCREAQQQAYQTATSSESDHTSSKLAMHRFVEGIGRVDRILAQGHLQTPFPIKMAERSRGEPPFPYPRRKLLEHSNYGLETSGFARIMASPTSSHCLHKCSVVMIFRTLQGENWTICLDSRFHACPTCMPNSSMRTKGRQALNADAAAGVPGSPHKQKLTPRSYPILSSTSTLHFMRSRELTQANRDAFNFQAILTEAHAEFENTKSQLRKEITRLADAKEEVIDRLTSGERAEIKANLRRTFDAEFKAQLSAMMTNMDKKEGFEARIQKLVETLKNDLGPMVDKAFQRWSDGVGNDFKETLKDAGNLIRAQNEAFVAERARERQRFEELFARQEQRIADAERRADKTVAALSGGPQGQALADLLLKLENVDLNKLTEQVNVVGKFSCELSLDQDKIKENVDSIKARLAVAEARHENLDQLRSEQDSIKARLAVAEARHENLDQLRSEQDSINTRLAVAETNDELFVHWSKELDKWAATVDSAWGFEDDSAAPGELPAQAAAPPPQPTLGQPAVHGGATSAQPPPQQQHQDGADGGLQQQHDYHHDHADTPTSHDNRGGRRGRRGGRGGRGRGDGIGRGVGPGRGSWSMIIKIIQNLIEGADREREIEGVHDGDHTSIGARLR